MKKCNQTPFSVRNDYVWDRLESDPRFAFCGVVPRGTQADMLFVVNAAAHMKPNTGRAVVMCLPSVLARGRTNDAIRERLIRENLVDAVIRIPEGTLYETFVSSCLLVLEAGKKKTDVFFMNAESYFTNADRGTRREITKEGIDKILSAIKARQDVSGKCCVAKFGEIERNGFSLAVEKYVLKRKLEKALKKETLVDFDSVAEVLIPRKIPLARGRRLTTNACGKHPFDYGKTTEGDATTVPVRKGNLVFRHRLLELIYLFDEEPKEEVFVPEGDLVVRPKNVQPEYLYYYFKTETGRTSFLMNSTSNVGRTALMRSMFEGLKIPLPKKNPEEYRRTFEIENHLNISMAAFNELLANKERYTCRMVIRYLKNVLETRGVEARD